MTEVTTHEVTLEPFTADAFAPFGWPVAAIDGPPVFEVARLASWRVHFEVDDELELMLARYEPSPLTFDRMERHAAVTQAFVPLGGVSSVMVVAAGGAEREPAAADVRAFLVPGDVGIVLRRNCWHALTRFPLGRTGAFALLTSAMTQAELEAERAGGSPPLMTSVIDWAARGTCFRIVDPLGQVDAAR